MTTLKTGWFQSRCEHKKNENCDENLEKVLKKRFDLFRLYCGGPEYRFRKFLELARGNCVIFVSVIFAETCLNLPRFPIFSCSSQSSNYSHMTLNQMAIILASSLRIIAMNRLWIPLLLWKTSGRTVDWLSRSQEKKYFLLCRNCFKNSADETEQKKKLFSGETKKTKHIETVTSTHIN